MKGLLIPSAALVPTEMRSNLGNIPQVLYPLNGKTMLEHICEKYKSSVDQIYVVGHKKYELIEDFVKWKKLDICVIRVPDFRQLGDTILFGLTHMLHTQKKMESVIINFADTIIEEESAGCLFPNAVFYDQITMDADWTFFEDDKKSILTIWDKIKKNYDQKIQKKVFVGVFTIQKPDQLLKMLEQETKTESQNMDSFYRALQSYSTKYPFVFSKVKKWFDVGHSENYLKAVTGVETRHFNQIELDEERGILLKKSTATDKFIGEIKWYVRMPEKLQYMLPRVYDYSLDHENSYIRMEYYGYHTLHELLVYGDTPLLKWQLVFRRLHRAVSDMRCYTVNDQDEIRKSLYEMYIDKTLNRLHRLKDDDLFSLFFENTISINGICYGSLNDLMQDIPVIVKKELIDDYQQPFTIIHGDLCFANILVEDGYQFIRMVDPRGKFGKFDIYGDPRYEIAKILHSLEGKYDYMIEDLFELEYNATSIRYKIRGDTEAIVRIFLEEFKDMGIIMHEVRLIESLLFLSMIPLHSDYPKRQMIMLATGLQLFYQTYGREAKDGRDYIYF